MTEDEIRLSVPAAPEFARLARLTVAGLATRVGFSYDDVEDLRIAIGEAYSLMISNSGRPSNIELVFHVSEEALKITVSGAGGSDPTSSEEAELSTQILEAVVDSFDLDGSSVKLTKLRVPADT